MILHCSFEELSVLGAAAERVLRAPGGGGVAAPPQVMADIEALAPRLTGDIGVDTLAEVRSIERASRFLLEDARDRTDALIIDEHPGAEAAVLAYFAYAHILTFLQRVERAGEQMAALIELMTGEPPTEQAARQMSFPD